MREALHAMAGQAGVVVTAVSAAAAALFGAAVPAWLPPTLIACALVVAAARRSGPRWLVGGALAVAMVALVALRADQDLAGLDLPLPERVDGTAQLAADPESGRFGTRVEVTVDGRRYMADFDRDTEGVVRALRMGNRVALSGAVSDLDRAPRGWVLSRHLAGRIRVSEAERVSGTRIWFRAANGVHELLWRGSGSMSEQHRALYVGLVVGDDRRQDELTQFRFRASGLTHLLAVSGQNLVFVLVALSPLTSRVTFRWRWALGALAIVGFVLVTRAEPSVLRAAAMALLGLTAAATGRTVPGVRTLCLAATGLLVADPMLVHSVGFRLSLAATAGLVLCAQRIWRLVPGPEWLARPLGVTLAAQAGAVPVMAATFGPTSVLAVPANLLAEPAAGLVMTLGMTSGLLAGVVREELAWVLQLPVRVAVWWVNTVAAGIAELSAPPLPIAGWVAIGAGLAAATALWRHRGHSAAGRCVLVAALPILLLVRPPLPLTGGSLELDGGATLRSCNESWVLEVGGGPGPQDAVSIQEGLWRQGLTRVALVSAAESTPALVDLAGRLGAVLVVGESRPLARGSPTICA